MQNILNWLDANNSKLWFALSGVCGILATYNVPVPPYIGPICLFLGGLTWNRSNQVQALRAARLTGAKQ